MPGLSGIDVCRMLRADPATADMLIIMTHRPVVRNRTWRAASAPGPTTT
ncbi:hypothetical protein [Actinoplanes nipponensis]